MIPYIINVALILAGCLAFHKLLLQKETFYKTNRYVLVICIAISFLLPLLQVPKEYSLRKSESKTKAITTVLPGTIVNNEPPQINEQPITTTETVGSSFSFQKLLTWMFWLYWFGVIAFGINFLIQLLILLLRANLNPVIRDGRYRIVELTGDKAPCSFGNTIFINPEKYDWDTYCQILEHEKIHIRQGHSFDIILAEIMLVFQWFNPFAWMYRKEIESNLEFLTDDQLVQKNKVEKSSYQLSLLKVSTPHFPLSLTTNYNQSLLKKRIVMMNSKRSNVHTAWKYFFLLPMLVLFASLLNKPVASAQSTPQKKETVDKKHKGIETEGSWFATIKVDKVQVQFKQDDEENSYNGSTFLVSDFTSLPRGTSGTFKLTREAGTMEFTGKFEGDQGMGRYKFIADKSYGQQMSKEVGETLDDRDMMVFFFINIKKSYVQMLKNEGYTRIEKNELIPLAALNIEKSFIQSLKQNGFKNVTLQELIPLKSLGIDGTYIKEIRGAGYSNISVNDLISFKAQGIDKNYLTKVNAANAKNQKNKEQPLNSQDVVAMKALNVDDDYINSFRAVGLTNISNNDLVSMKSVGVTPEYVKSFIDMGYKDIHPGDLIPLKAQHVTTEYIKSFETVGFKNISLHQIISLKALGVTPEYIKSMKEKGFNYDRIDKYVTLKSID